MPRHISLIVLFVLIGSFAYAQMNLPKPDLNPFRVPENTLFNPNNLRMTHSMGFEASSSSSGDAFYLSRYTNHINYSFSPKLDMQLDLSFVNYGSADTGGGFKFNEDNKNRIIPSFSMSYRPTDTMRIDFHYRQQEPLPQSHYRQWYERW